jgi:hypothetical protein
MDKKTNARKSQPIPVFLTLLVVACVVLIMLSVSAALQEGGLRADSSGQDIYTLEPNTAQ